MLILLNQSKEIKNMQIKQQADEFELELRKVFARPQLATELRQAYYNVLNAQGYTILISLKKLLKWSKAKEKAEAETSEHNRDIARRFSIIMILSLSLKIVSEARGTASYASAEASKAAAEASRTQADVNEKIVVCSCRY